MMLGSNRTKILAGIFICGTLVLSLQAFYLQVADSSFLTQAEETYVSKKVVVPSRGLIYDRNDVLLAENRRAYDLLVNFSMIDTTENYEAICQILDLEENEFWDRIDKDWNSIHYSQKTPFVFYPNVNPEQYNMLQEHMHHFKAFHFNQKYKRSYSTENGANFLGYMNETNLKQIEANELYTPGDLIGSSGIEERYEEHLRGEKGVEYVLRNKYGKEVGPVQDGQLNTPALSGEDLKLSIDIELQAFAEDLIKHLRGSIVAIQPSTGEILCLATGPSFNPSLLEINKDRAEIYNDLLTDPNKPLFDRSIMAKYPPGSIFKTLVGLVALELGVTQPKRYIPCSGMYYYNGVPFKCHKHPVTANIQTALEYSCNTYFRLLLRDIVDIEDFYKPQVGLDTFVHFSHQFGLGKKMNIDLPGETKGNIPTSAYYNNLYPRTEGRWKSPTIMSIGIGQGEVELSNLQMANLAAAIANRGFYYEPHLVKQLNNKSTFNKTKQKIKIDRKHYDPIIAGMRKVIRSGTGQYASIPGIDYCGKTGTSQNPHGEDHSIFFGFAPVDNPDIAISVIIENAGSGASIAAPISSLVVEKYMRDSIMPERKYWIDYIKNFKLSQP